MLYGEAEIQATIAALEAEQVPAVSVSLDLLKKLSLDKAEGTKRYDEVPYSELYTYKEACAINPEYPKLSPFDLWSAYPGKIIGMFNQRVNIYENRRCAILVDWLPYITSAFLQPSPELFLEYLRLLPSTKNNPWVVPTFYATTQDADAQKGPDMTHDGGAKFRWADGISEYVFDADHNYPPLVMYPHTLTDTGVLDMSITLDRFIETLISDSLGQAFTILDIARTTDPKFLEWAYSKILNRSSYIKSQIAEGSTIQVIQDGSIIKTISVRLNPDLQVMFQKAADDALVLIRQNQDKLAARVIEVKTLQSQGVTAEFIGPVWLNPLTVSTMTTAEIEKKISALPYTKRTMYNLPTKLKQTYYGLEPLTVPKTNGTPVKKTNLLLPVAGVAAAAIGIYMATR